MTSLNSKMSELQLQIYTDPGQILALMRDHALYERDYEDRSHFWHMIEANQIPWSPVGMLWHPVNGPQPLKIEQVVALALFDGDDVVGFLLAECYEDGPAIKGLGQGYAGSLDAALMAYVKPHWRQRGIASRLLRTIEPELVNRLGITESHLSMVIATGSLKRLASRSLRVLVSTQAPSNTTIWRQCLREYPRYHSMIERRLALYEMDQGINKKQRCA